MVCIQYETNFKCSEFHHGSSQSAILLCPFPWYIVSTAITNYIKKPWNTNPNNTLDVYNFSTVSHLSHLHMKNTAIKLRVRTDLPLPKDGWISEPICPQRADMPAFIYNIIPLSS